MHSIMIACTNSTHHCPLQDVTVSGYTSLFILLTPVLAQTERDVIAPSGGRFVYLCRVHRALVAEFGEGGV